MVIEENKVASFPLEWPIGYRRTKQRSTSQFKQTPERAQQFMRSEFRKLGARDVVVSSNIPLRQDGLLRSDAMRYQNKANEDSGVAVYFNYKGKQMVLCCDRYSRVWENVYAIGKTVQAIRAMERYGVSEFLDRAFSGFNKLLTTPYQDPWLILGVKEFCSEREIDEAFKAKARVLHPDSGGTEHQFKDLTWARDEAKRLLKS